MKNFTSLILFLLLGSGLTAQNWCPPGATWYHRMYIPYNGHVKLQVTGTVSINNITCFNMNGVFTGQTQQPNGPVTSMNLYSLNTYESNGVIHIYNTSTQLFDTIANFNASIGDKWLKLELPPGNCQPSNRVALTVIDTGHVIINGISLKTLSLSVPWGSSSYTHVAVERISSTTGFLAPYISCLLDSPGYGDFVCYSDNNFPTYNPTSDVCAYIPTGITKNSADGSYLNAYPNPINNQLTIELPDAAECEIFLADLLGNTWPLKTSTIGSSKLQADLHAFHPGVYFMSVYHNGGLAGVEKIVKE